MAEESTTVEVGYDDLKDLIQNQRALAELVAKMKADYDTVKNDMDFAREVNDKINDLNNSMQTVLDNYNRRITESEDAAKNMIASVTNNAEQLKNEAEEIVNTLQVNGTYSFTLLNDNISALTTLVRGSGDYLEGDTQGNRTNGMVDLLNRVQTLEAKTPSIQIADEGTEILLTDRLDGVLYGKITDEVRDIEKGQTIKISPSLQGVVQ